MKKIKNKYRTTPDQHKERAWIVLSGIVVAVLLAITAAVIIDTIVRLGFFT